MNKENQPFLAVLARKKIPAWQRILGTSLLALSVFSCTLIQDIDGVRGKVEQTMEVPVETLVDQIQTGVQTPFAQGVEDIEGTLETPVGQVVDEIQEKVQTPLAKGVEDIDDRGWTVVAPIVTQDPTPEPVQ